MKYIYFYIWLALAIIHPWISKIFYPINWIIMKVGRKSDQEYEAWKKNYNNAMLEFPGGINDWFAFAAFILIFNFLPLFALLIILDLIIPTFWFSTIFLIIIGFSYYWIYYRKIDWLKERINKVSKKYYIK